MGDWSGAASFQLQHSEGEHSALWYISRVLRPISISEEITDEFHSGSYVAAEFNVDAYEYVELSILDVGQF